MNPSWSSHIAIIKTWMESSSNPKKFYSVESEVKCHLFLMKVYCPISFLQWLSWIFFEKLDPTSDYEMKQGCLSLTLNNPQLMHIHPDLPT